jgi:hypothetical protein
MKDSNDTIGNRARDIPTCSAVPQQTAIPRAPTYTYNKILFCKISCNSKYSSLQFEMQPLGEYQGHFYYNQTSLYLSFSFRPLCLQCLRLFSVRHNAYSDHIRRYFLAG